MEYIYLRLSHSLLMYMFIFIPVCRIRCYHPFLNILMAENFHTIAKYQERDNFSMSCPSQSAYIFIVRHRAVTEPCSQFTGQT